MINEVGKIIVTGGLTVKGESSNDARIFVLNDDELVEGKNCVEETISLRQAYE